MQIAEGYGMTETSAASFVNRVKAYRYGSVGWPLPGTEVRIADDGEVLLRGSGNMEGYHNNPEATAETIDAEGWLHTGDIGELDDRGFLRITDRKKDMFKTSGGKYVAPSNIEATFKGLCPYASQLVVYGADRNFVSALVTLDPEAITGWAAQNGMAGQEYTAIVRSDACHAMVQGYIDQLNAGLNRWETIKKFTILENDLTVEAGELTPSLKLKRKVVSEKYQEQLDAHYTLADPVASRPRQPGRSVGDERDEAVVAVLGDPPPVGRAGVALDAQHPAGHRHHEDAGDVQLGDQRSGSLVAMADTSTRSNGASSGAPSTPATDARTRAHGIRAASTLALPVSTRSGTRSSPSTEPVGPTRAASRAVVQPDPDPTSSTRCPGRTSSSSSIARTVRGWLLVWPWPMSSGPS